MRRLSFGVKLIGVVGLAVAGLVLFMFGWGSSDPVSPMEPASFFIELTPEELVWLKDHPVIRVASDAGWAPIEWKNEEGVFLGLAIDYLREVEAQLNVDFEIVESPSWQALLRSGQEREVDLFSCMNPTLDRMQYLLFTHPYISVPIKLYAREVTGEIGGVQGLDGTRVAVVDGYAIAEFLKVDYPHIQLVPVKTIQEGLILLSQGEVYALAGNQLTAEYSIDQLGLESIKVAGDTPYGNHLGMGVRKDWPILVNILQKSMDAIPEEVLLKIFRRWNLEETVRWPMRIPLWVWGLIGGAVGISFLLSGMSWFLKHQVNVRTAELGASEARYRMLVERQTDLVVKVDVAGRFLYASPTYCRLFGKTKKELLGQTFVPLVHKDDCATTEEAIAALQHPPHKSYMEQRVMTKDGWRWLAWQDSAILDENGALKEIIRVGRDITARKEAEAAYHESNERLQLATEAAHVGIWEYDPVHDHFIGDEELFSQYGICADDFRGGIEAWLKLVHPEDRAMTGQVFRGALGNKEPFETEFRVIWPDQSIHYIRGLGSVDFDAEGLPIRTIGASWEVTRSNRMMAALKESEEGYRQLFENMTTGFMLLQVDQNRSGVPENFRILQVNPAAEELMGASQFDLVGKTLKEVLQPLESYWLDLFVKVATTGKAAAYEDRMEAVDRVWSMWVFEHQSGQVAVVFSDNTARHMAEDAEVRTRHQLEHLIDNTKDVIFQIDLKGNYIFANAAAEEVCGYSSDKLLKMNMMELIVPEHQSRILRRLKHRLEGHAESGSVEFDIIHRDGRRISMELLTNPVYDAWGMLEAVQGIARDVTQRNQSERALEESRRFLRTIIDTIPVHIFWKDVDSNFMGSNLLFAQSKGFEHPDELIGKNDYDLYSIREDAEKYRADDREVMASGVSNLNYEESLSLPDGTMRWLSTSKVPIRDGEGGVIGVLGVYEDITARKLLAEERMRLMAAINQTAETIVIMDTKGQVEYVNSAFEALTGYSQQEAVGENLSIIKQMGDDEYYSKVRETISAGNTWCGRVENRHRNGSFYIVEVAISPVRDADGTVVNYVATVRNVTQEEELEANLRQAQKMDAVGRLAGGVAHDFNNILQSILGFSSMLLAELEAGSPQYDDASEIRKAAHRAADLTHQLLALSRKPSVEYSMLDLNKIVMDSERMLRSLIGGHIEFVFNLDPDLKPFRADLTQIEQILLNLFLNGRDAMPEGGRLMVSTWNLGDEERAGLDSVGAPEQEYICLLVSDTGGGIREEVREHLFEPFFTTKQVGQGTGLGLSVVYGIVRQHGGWIDVSSTVGEGAEFRIYLPVSDSPRVESGKPGMATDSGKTPEGRGELIWVLDGDPILRELGLRMLTNAGYVVESFADMETAVQRLDCSDNPPDLLLTEVLLPDGSGVDFGLQVREKVSDISVLLCSGHSHDAALYDTLKSNGFRFLEKPVATMNLLQTIREMLDKKVRV